MTLQSTPREASSAHRPATSRLAASRSAALCGTEGLEAVFRRAVAAGEANGCDSIDQWLEAIIEGEAEDLIAAERLAPMPRPAPLPEGRPLPSAVATRLRGRSSPLPPVGRGRGWGSAQQEAGPLRNPAVPARRERTGCKRVFRQTPTPDPSPQGGGEPGV